MLTPTQYGFLAIAAVAAGLINALAGGGSLITFPTLMAVGIPPVMANVTNTVALCPGYLGATLAQKKRPARATKTDSVIATIGSYWRHYRWYFAVK